MATMIVDLSFDDFSSQVKDHDGQVQDLALVLDQDDQGFLQNWNEAIF